MKSTSSVLKFVMGRNGQPPRFLFGVQSGRIEAASFSSQSVESSSPAGKVMAGPGSPTLDPTKSIFDKNAEGEDNTADAIEGQSSTISKAMFAYLKRAKEHQEFMDKQEKEFVFGRRHLANMMGKDPESFTQKDIDEAIRYLFPCGLYEPRARPMMKPPSEIYPKQKSAQFDMSGRPHHPFFFTAKPNFYYLLHEMVGKLNSMNKLGASKSEISIDDSTLAGSQWLSKDELEERLLEKINEPMYNEWVYCFERLAAHSKRDKELEFIKSYRKPLAQQAKGDSLPPVTLEPDGRKSVHIPVLQKKSARADILVTVPGTGQFKINGKGLDYFKRIQSREAVISPLQLCGWLGKVDVEANCEGGTLAALHLEEPGETSRAICVRYGIATALAALGADIEKLRLAGYLTYDRRVRERNKHGQDGARAKWTWKKR